MDGYRCCAEGLCQQLAEVAAALLATSFPGAHFSINTTTTTSSSNTPSSSTAAPTLQHQVSLALVWERLRGLLLAVLNVAGQVGKHWGLLRCKAPCLHFMHSSCSITPWPCDLC
jgi:hypothetical protein